jgi:hypothetical protein
MLVSFSLAAVAADKPYNVNPYSWTATINQEKVSGEGEASRLEKAWHGVQASIDSMAAAGKVRDRQEVVVDLLWRGKEFRRTVVARATHDPKYPQELPRGPLKNELPRGPLPREKMRRN